MSNIEQTLSIIKPDAVERNLEGKIKEMFKNNGFQILKEKKIQIEKPCFLNISFISFSRFLSTASGLIIDKVCSMLLIMILD